MLSLELDQEEFAIFQLALESSKGASSMFLWRGKLNNAANVKSPLLGGEGGVRADV
jgi:hypothetical protein